MTRHHGGETVQAGAYFNAKALSFKVLDDEETLPGTAADEYVALPMAAMLVVGPALGLVYAIFLPFIGLAMAAWVVLEKAGDVLATGARVMRPAWQPALSFLTRGKKGTKAGRRDAWAEEAKKAAGEDEAH